MEERIVNTQEQKPAALSYEDHLPLAWQPLPENDASQLHEHENLGALFAAAALEEHREVGGEEGPLQEEIRRLHQKMDLLVSMMCSLIRAQTLLPEVVSLQLSAQRVIWRHGANPPLPQQRVLVEIYLHRGLAQPLRLPARVVSVADGVVDAVFEPLAETSLAALEQHVFLRHRRSIAGARQAAQR